MLHPSNPPIQAAVPSVDSVPPGVGSYSQPSVFMMSHLSCRTLMFNHVGPSELVPVDSVRGCARPVTGLNSNMFCSFCRL